MVLRNGPKRRKTFQLRFLLSRNLEMQYFVFGLDVSAKPYREPSTGTRFIRGCHTTKPEPHDDVLASRCSRRAL